MSKEQTLNTYMSFLVEKIQPILVHGQDTGRNDGVVTATLDVEE